jgi:uncharacterized delta-60 repeat protein
MSVLNLLLGFGEGKNTYWISTIGGSGNDTAAIGNISLDNSDNVYISGYTNSQTSGNFDIIIAKYDKFGANQWQRRLGGAGLEFGYSTAIDSLGDVYVTGFTDSQGAGGNDIVLAKYNNSGTLQWQKRLGGTGNDIGYGLDIDSSDNIYLCGGENSQVSGGLGREMFIVRYDTSGTVQWQRRLGGTSEELGYKIAVDNLGDVFVAGSTDLNGRDGLLAKYNNSGTLQWQIRMGINLSDVFYSIAVDNSDGVYVTGVTNGPGTALGDVIICKFNKSGTLQWQRRLGGVNSEEGTGIALDANGNIYVNAASNTPTSGTYKILLAKYNNSGTIQWQRTLGGSSGTTYSSGIRIGSSGDIYITGRTNIAGAGNFDILIAKLPADGSLTGTYGTLTYEASSLTEAAAALGVTTTTFASAATTLTEGTITLTDAATTLTTTVIEL